MERWFRRISHLEQFHSRRLHPLLCIDDLELLLTQYLGPVPTKKIVALHHRPPLPFSETSSVPMPKPFLQAHPLHPRASLYLADPCALHPAPKGCSSLISQKRRNANRRALRLVELPYHPWQLQRHAQWRGHQMSQEA